MFHPFSSAAASRVSAAEVSVFRCERRVAGSLSPLRSFSQCTAARDIERFGNIQAKRGSVSPLTARGSP